MALEASTASEKTLKKQEAVQKILDLPQKKRLGLLEKGANKKLAEFERSFTKTVGATTLKMLKQTKRKNIKIQNIMIIMPVKEGENIERALKKFKRKYERTGVLKELRRRQYFTKPSIAKREAMMHAVYVEHMYRDEE